MKKLLLLMLALFTLGLFLPAAEAATIVNSSATGIRVIRHHKKHHRKHRRHHHHRRHVLVIIKK